MLVLGCIMKDRSLERIRNALAGDAPLQGVVDALAELPHYDWVGIYLVKGRELVLGPWRGAKATEHVRIPIGQGICGAAAATGRTEVVADVTSDPRYLACFPTTRSEIVVPIVDGDEVLGEIDIDSNTPAAFGDEDRRFLEEVARLLVPHLREGV
jgi:GAF domain-containing protein